MKPYPDELKERARALYVRGEFGYKQVARELGIPAATVARWCNPDYEARERAASKARKDNYRGVCVDCGASTSYSGVSVYGSERCGPCYRAHTAASHGTQHMYGNLGCRCDECREGNRARRRALQGKPAPSHSYSGYINYRCRCDICRAANTEYERARRERRRQAA